MRHKQARHRLNRFTSWHDATLLSIAKNVLIRESIVTTKAKAFAAKPLLEKLISLGKKNSLHAKRQAYKILGEHKLVSLLFADIAPRFSDRAGGYSRILGFARRRGDNAALVVFELSQIKKKEAKKRKKKKEDPKEELKAEQEPKKEKLSEEKKVKTEVSPAEVKRPPITKKPNKKFFGGLRNIFKKERDSL